jgi:hypothetical protein
LRAASARNHAKIVAGETMWQQTRSRFPGPRARSSLLSRPRFPTSCRPLPSSRGGRIRTDDILLPKGVAGDPKGLLGVASGRLG